MADTTFFNLKEENDGGQLHWYAFKVFYNKVFEMDELLRKGGVKTFYPVVKVEKTVDGVVKKVDRPAISSLIFLRCTCGEVIAWQRALTGKVMLYSHVIDGMRFPSPIDEEEMRVFILVTSSNDDRLEYLDVSNINYRSGQKVRVVGGPFEGCIGYIKRIKGNRRLLVAVEGLALVATSYIPTVFLEKL